MLRADAEGFARTLAERKVIDSPDPEIVRLSALADQAERDGLLSSADSFRDRVKARFRELEPTLGEQQAALDRRYIEGAAVFQHSAGAKALAFDHLAAARDYAEAFRLVEGQDAQLALRYKQSETTALTNHGYYRGDNAALVRAIATGREALRMAGGFGERGRQAWMQSDLGDAVRILGGRESGKARLEEAVAIYRAALEERTRERVPLDRAWTQSRLGDALGALGDAFIARGDQENGTARLASSLPTTCKFVERDQYDRFVGNCTRADGANVQRWLVRNGHAMDWPRYSNGGFAKEQSAARAEKIGVWQGSFQPPWEWRTAQRKQSDSSSTVSLVPSAASPATASEQSGACNIKGNISRKGERIYHVPGQKYYAQTQISPSKGERWFCSEQEARAAGWRRSQQ